jgi:hypothetical protein
MGYSTCDLAEKFVFVNAAEDRGKGLLAEVEYYETIKDLDNRHNHCHHPPTLELEQIERLFEEAEHVENAHGVSGA